MAKLFILSSLSAPPSFARFTVFFGIALPLLSTSCEKKVETLFDESGVWTLTEFQLGPKMPSEEEESDNPSPGEFKKISPEASNGFLLNFDASNKIVTAVSCARSKGESHDPIDSLCFLGDSKARDWRCSCFSYTFEGDTMKWSYLGGDEDAFARQKLARAFDSPGVAIGFPNDEDLRGEDKESEDKESEDKESKDKESKADTSESDGRYKDTVITVKNDPERGNAYHFSPLPGSNIKGEEGLFQSNGQTSVYVFQHRANRFFEETGCAKACEDM